MRENEHLIGSIMNIRKSNLASITYWAIAISNKSIYFCKLANNELPGIYGAIQDSLSLNKANKTKQDLKHILNISKKYYVIDREENGLITYTKTFLGGNVDFCIEDGKIMHLKLNNQQYNKLLEINNSKTINTKKSIKQKNEITIVENPVNEIKRSYVIALTLSIAFGYLGFDQLYLGKTIKGIAKLCTFGLFGVLWLVDIYLILTKSIDGVILE